jgi:hypothetical protein
LITLPFSELYISECENCGNDLEDWVWLQDDMIFTTSCSCGAQYTIEPVTANLICENDNVGDDNDDEEDD